MSKEEKCCEEQKQCQCNCDCSGFAEILRKVADLIDAN